MRSPQLATPAFSGNLHCPLRKTGTNRFSSQFCRRQESSQRPSPCSQKRERPGVKAVIESFNKLSIRFDCKAPVASGSFGEVFFGLLEPTGEPVVLKRSYSSATARTLFRTERAINRKIDTTSEQRPAHWPKFLGDYFRHSQTFLVWLREGDGCTLQDFISGRPAGALAAALGLPAVAPGSVLNYVLFRYVVGTLLLGLQDLHDRGVVHRDVKPANVVVGDGGGAQARAALKLIDFGSSCDMRKPFWWRGVDTLDPLYAAPERRLSVLGPEKFDVFSVGMIGASVLMPGFSSEARLREFKLRLEAADYDLMRYRDEVSGGVGGACGDDRELGALFDRQDELARDTLELLAGMLKKNPAARRSVKGCLSDLGMA